MAARLWAQNRSNCLLMCRASVRWAWRMCLTSSRLWNVAPRYFSVQTLWIGRPSEVRRLTPSSLVTNSSHFSALSCRLWVALWHSVRWRRRRRSGGRVAMRSVSSTHRDIGDARSQGLTKSRWRRSARRSRYIMLVTIINKRGERGQPRRIPLHCPISALRLSAQLTVKRGSA